MMRNVEFGIEVFEHYLLLVHLLLFAYKRLSFESYM